MSEKKPIKISHFNRTRTLLLFSLPMRDKDTSALRKIFQCSSLAKKPFHQWEIATHWRAFQIQNIVTLIKTKPNLTTYCPWQLMVSLSFWVFLFSNNANYHSEKVVCELSFCTILFEITGVWLTLNSRIYQSSNKIRTWGNLARELCAQTC